MKSRAAAYDAGMGQGWLRAALVGLAGLAIVGASCRASTDLRGSRAGAAHDTAAAVRCDGQPAVASIAQALSTIDCTAAEDTGYTNGTPFAITVVTVDGEKVERATANAYYVMAQAAEGDGVQIRINSGFRTMAEQERLYACYVECNCNNCNLAAEPGYSNHQSGHALDLNTSAGGVLDWLNANGAAFGFEATVASEDWHWEWWGGGPGGGPCGGAEYAGRSLGVSGQSYPIVSAGPVMVAVGETVTGWVMLENTGTATWTPGVVWLAPMPRDQPSPFASASWLNATRISTVAADVAPGQVGEFALDIAGSAPGQSILSLGWVAEQLTWFADAPRGGGPADGYFAVDVQVVPGAAEPEPEPGMPARDAAAEPDDDARDGGPDGAGSDGGERGERDDAGASASSGRGPGAPSARRDAGDHDGGEGDGDADDAGCSVRRARSRTASSVWFGSLVALWVLLRRGAQRGRARG